MKYSFAGLSLEDILEHKRYEQNIPKEVKLFVLERDRWSCRSCNSNYMIQPHHIIPRSLSVDHHPNNLITLCFDCHRRIHDGNLLVVVVNGNFFFGGQKRWN